LSARTKASDNTATSRRLRVRLETGK
jgi:hypothetical protein